MTGDVQNDLDRLHTKKLLGRVTDIALKGRSFDFPKIEIISNEMITDYQQFTFLVQNHESGPKINRVNVPSAAKLPQQPICF